MRKTNLICPVCTKRQQFSFVMDVPNIHWKKIKTKNFQYFSCDVCAFWVLLPTLSVEDKKIIYKGNYYSNLASPLNNFFLRNLFKVKLFESYKDFVIRYSHIKKVFDIGCGAGDFLLEMKNEGFEVVGIDPYEDAVELSRRKVGIDNITLGSILSLKKRKQTYENITMWHVLEHTDNPYRDLKILSEKLRSKGLIFIEVPNSDSFNMHLFKKFYAWQMVPEHHYYFNPESLTALLRHMDFKIIKIYSPPRALLNFSYSVKNLTEDKRLFSQLLFFLSIPFSIFLTLLFSSLNRGEVVRVVAIKK